MIEACKMKAIFILIALIHASTSDYVYLSPTGVPVQTFSVINIPLLVPQEPIVEIAPTAGHFPYPAAEPKVSITRSNQDIAYPYPPAEPKNPLPKPIVPYTTAKATHRDAAPIQQDTDFPYPSAVPKQNDESQNFPYPAEEPKSTPTFPYPASEDTDVSLTPTKIQFIPPVQTKQATSFPYPAAGVSDITPSTSLPYPPAEDENQDLPYPPAEDEIQKLPYPPAEDENQDLPYPPAEDEIQKLPYPPAEDQNQDLSYPPAESKYVPAEPKIVLTPSASFPYPPPEAAEKEGDYPYPAAEAKAILPTWSQKAVEQNVVTNFPYPAKEY